MKPFTLSKRARHLLPVLSLFAVALLPVKAHATLLGDFISSACVSIGTGPSCNAGENLFSSTSGTVVNEIGGDPEFVGVSSEDPDFNASADFDTVGGVDFITLTITGEGDGAEALVWDFSGLDWVGEPTGVISGIVLESGTLGHTATPAGHALNFLTDGFMDNNSQPVVLVFSLTTMLEIDDDDEEDDEASLPTPSSLLLLLAGLPLVLTRRRR